MSKETMTPEQHYNLVMENWDRVMLEDEFHTLKARLLQLEEGLLKASPIPDVPVVAEVEGATAPLSPSETPKQPEAKKGWKKVAAVVALGAIAVGTAFGISKALDKDKESKVANGATPTRTVTTPATTLGPTVSESQLVAKKYRNIDTGSDEQGLIGSFNIDPNNPEASQKRFFTELRHNPQALAFWNSCLETGKPSYDACVNDEEVLAKAKARTVSYSKMNPATKGVIAEDVVSEFKAMKYNGVSIHSGPYRTVGVNGSTFFPMTNSRSGDAWISYTDDKGNTFFIRECDQIVEEIKITTKAPKKEKPAQPKPPVVEEEPKPEIEIKPDCPPGYISEKDRCVHPPAGGPPPEVSQPPHPVKPTPGYKPGNAEDVAGTQNGDPTNLNPTPNGTEVPNSGGTNGGSPAGSATPENPAAPANPDHKPNTSTPGTDADITTPQTAPEAQTPATPGTTAPGSDSGGF